MTFRNWTVHSEVQPSLDLADLKDLKRQPHFFISTGQATLTVRSVHPEPLALIVFH